MKGRKEDTGALGKAIFGFVNETLNDVVDSAIDDLLRDTGVDRAGKEEPKPAPPSGKKPKPIPVGHGEKDDDDKPLKWDSKPKVEKVVASKGIQGGLDEKKTKSKSKRSPKQYEWHAHHPWPKFMGGKEEQPKMGVRSYVHISLVHPMLAAFLKAKGYKVAVNKGPDVAPNKAFVARLKSDAIFKAEVMDDLMIFYAGLNKITNPTIPGNAYGLGIEYTFRHLR